MSIWANRSSFLPQKWKACLVRVYYKEFKMSSYRESLCHNQINFIIIRTVLNPFLVVALL
jgi:hypothetical protein